VSYHVGTASTGKAIASSHSISTQQDKNILESIMHLVTSDYQ